MEHSTANSMQHEATQCWILSICARACSEKTSRFHLSEKIWYASQENYLLFRFISFMRSQTIERVGVLP
jgi:hypothetical protein